MDRLRSRGIFSGKGLKRQQVRNGLWSEQSSRRTYGWGSCILAQHPSAGLDFVPQANSARKMRARSQGSPSFAQEKGQIIDGISLRCLPQNSVCRRTQGVKEGRGGRWGGEKNGSKFSWGYWRFFSSQISARKKNRSSARPAGPSVAGSFIKHPALYPTTPTPPSLSPNNF